ncbi:MAG: hypothetical protein K6F68_09465 [Clostridiales bacterium]|nr:hypothetical protein [Clostridiales bacterium]
MLFNILSLVSNALIFVLTAYSVISFYVKGGDANMKVRNEKCFEYFTVDSNILAAITSAVMIVFNIMSFSKGGFAAPMWALVFKLVGATAVGLTFLVVVTMLAPFAEKGFFSLFEGSSFFMHFLTPVLAMLSFVLFEGGMRIGFINILFALIPTIIYAVVYFIMVLIVGEEKGGWNDFYGFNKGGKWYITAPVIIGMTALISFGLIALHNLTS